MSFFLHHPLDTNKGALKCKKCDFSSNFAIHLYRHTKNAHTDGSKIKNSVYKCKKCMFQSEDLNEFLKHTKKLHLLVKL